MIVELISVGTELLLGNIVNTNAAYLSEMCARRGLSLYYQTVVGDNWERMAETIRTALGRSDILLITGGLGPTEDDITKEVVAQVMGRRLLEDKHTRERIQAYMEAYAASAGLKEIPENNWKQAQIPEGARVLDNENGTAPGLILDDGGKHVILLPGPPEEMRPLFEEQVYPYLGELSQEVIVSKMVKLCGIGESSVAEMAADLIAAQSNPTIATYAKVGEVHLRITAKAETEQEARKLLKPLVREVKLRFGPYIYSTEEKGTLEGSILDLLNDKGLTLVTAESCTGGMLASRIINVPGASEVLKAGLVTYSNRMKRKYLGVKKSTLKTDGAVSEKTAREMARGGCEQTEADVCVAITGIAGPDGGTEEKPVGLVYIGCCAAGKIKVKRFQFTGGRAKVRSQSVSAALTLLRECVLEQYYHS
ncbi:MAG TPA: competence/damage-inducible protein A [Candidatus Egerieimonas intestinavium]|uniref:Putative competence-damage inducible protein n=1 Tax=Candidatus Egerieimonas intestinavium TaxID=2840777 RepID=A0A9D1JGN7_9FIRM|nr:competence/damage-inducible protein A [Candidatus Egerieimonas intestinavium]